MVVHAGAEEGELDAHMRVLRRERVEVRDDLLLRERRLEVERPPEPNAGGNLAEELVDGRDADRREHLLAVLVGQRDVSHASSSSSFR